MTISADVQTLAPGSLIEMYILDTTVIGGGTVLRFHPGVAYSATTTWNDIVWQGVTYNRWPVDASGFEWSGKGQIPRPKIMVSNILGSITSLNYTNDDLVGAKVTRKRTFLKYLDAINFPGNVNPTADPSVYFADDVYYVDRKSNENPIFCEYELTASFDVQGKLLPGRQIIQNSCPWTYRDGVNCTYAGSNYFTVLDVATSAGLDVCGKRLNSCKLRFGTTAILPYGGFPSSGLT
jgi:lambda family phage minor tail protein L